MKQMLQWKWILYEAVPVWDKPFACHMESRPIGFNGETKCPSVNCPQRAEEPGAVRSFLFKLKILSTYIDKANITVAAIVPS